MSLTANKNIQYLRNFRSSVMGLDSVQRHASSMEDAPEIAENWYTTRSKMV